MRFFLSNERATFSRVSVQCLSLDFHSFETQEIELRRTSGLRSFTLPKSSRVSKMRLATPSAPQAETRFPKTRPRIMMSLGSNQLALNKSQSQPLALNPITRSCWALS